MSKRDHETEIWSEDWFIDLGSTGQLFWFYIKDKCDHAGFWRPNFKQFEIITGHRVNQKEFIEKANSGKERIMILENGKWWLTGFIAFHFRGVLNLANRFHKSVFEIFSKNITCLNTSDYGFEVKLTSLRPHTEQGTGNREQGINLSLKEGMQGEKPPGPEKPQSKIIPPKREWVKKYCEDRENGIDPDSFFDHYETRGWIPKGATKQMKDWQAAIRTWEKFKKENGNNKADETRWKFLEGK
jgi:hypothetical protein